MAERITGKIVQFDGHAFCHDANNINIGNWSSSGKCAGFIIHEVGHHLAASISDRHKNNLGLIIFDESSEWKNVKCDIRHALAESKARFYTRLLFSNFVADIYLNRPRMMTKDDRNELYRAVNYAQYLCTVPMNPILSDIDCRIVRTDLFVRQLERRLAAVGLNLETATEFVKIVHAEELEKYFILENQIMV